MNVFIKASPIERQLALKKPAQLGLLTLHANNTSASEMTQTGQGFIIKSGSHSENRMSLIAFIPAELLVCQTAIREWGINE
jgi:hypothetical protein